MKRSLSKAGLRKTVCAIMCATLLLPPLSTQALMAGSAPDTPEARIDRRGTESPFAGVGSITIGQGTYTGTLISPRHVLTAAHVVGDAAYSTVTFNLISHGEIIRRVAVTAIHKHPAYTGFETGKPAEADLAVLELAEDVPSIYPRYPLLRTPVPAGTSLVLAGFGGSGQGDKGESVPMNPAVRRIGGNRADVIRPSRGGRANAVYYFDFDGPSPEHNRFGDAGLGNTWETTLAGGDSGGPAFVRGPRGTLYLAGVNSFRFGDQTIFGNGGGGQLVAAYADWIDSVVAAESPAVDHR